MTEDSKINVGFTSTGQKPKDLVLAPRVPTAEMLYAASDVALAENAEWV